MKRIFSNITTFIGSFSIGLVLALTSLQALSEDIDIFTLDLNENVNKPNVLIILDNSANWSRQAQQWTGCEEGAEYDAITNPPPGGCSPITQGQSETRAIQNVIEQLGENTINLGLLLYRTQGSSPDRDSGYVRHHIRPLVGDISDPSTNRGDLAAKLQTMFDNINDPIEKRDQANPFGNLMWEAYNYLSGFNSIQTVTDYTTSPWTLDPNGPGTGTPAIADSGAYDSSYDNFRTPLNDQDTCTRTIIIFIGNNTQSGPRVDTLQNQDALQSLGGNTEQIEFSEFEIFSAGDTTNFGYSSSCYSDIASCTSAEDRLCMLNDGFEEPFTAEELNDPTRLKCECIDTASYAKQACTLNQYGVVGRTRVRVEPGSTSSIEFINTSTGDAAPCLNSSQDPNPLGCPSNSPPSSVFTETQEIVTTTEWGDFDGDSRACYYLEDPNTCGGGGNKSTWYPRGDKRETTTTYDLTNDDTNLGNVCSETSTCDVSSFDCSAYDFCFCPDSPTGTCSTGTFKYMVKGTFQSTSAVPTGNLTAPPPGPFMADEWARFLRGEGITVPGTSVKTPATTYTIDVFNAQQHPDFSGLLFNMARVGGGKYYQAKNENQIKKALLEIFTDIQAVNTAFSSASLPVNATNRAQNENQVFIGLFRPDKQASPLWFGNLKRYQLVQNGSSIELGDVNGNPAVNELTGFISDCAASYWTTASGDYWGRVNTDIPDAFSMCNTITAGTEHSDLPDGPFVEKGAAAQVLRKGNNDPGADVDAQGNYGLSRNLETISGNSLVEFSVANSGGFFDPAVSTDVNTVKFAKGEDIFDDDSDPSGQTREFTEPRSTIHGDVVHSRPQPVNYGGANGLGVVIFYGANDGTYRAVNAENGTELWSFIAPEHFSKLARLRAGSPAIVSGTNDSKDYFFDGTTGIYQTFNASNEADKVLIFPTMRRGGRKTYAFDVTDPSNPTYLWSAGCVDEIPDTVTCDTGYEDMGQSWSQGNVALIKGHSLTEPVIVMGGGYNPCEDPDLGSPTCSDQIGSGVYVIRAEEDASGTPDNVGDLLHYFDFNARSVAADVALIDVDQDEYVDFGFAVDTGGNIYRMDFVDPNNGFAARAPADWRWNKIAYTNGSDRKFLFAPALIQASGSEVFVAIGSGDREHPLFNDYPKSDPVLNRFYTFRNNFTVDDTSTPAAPVLNLDDETPDSATDTNYMFDYTTYEDASGTPLDPCTEVAGILPDDPTSPAGWFIDLSENGTGEQVVTSAVIAAGTVIFSTNEATENSDVACTNSLGIARGYTLNLLNASGVLGVDGICGGNRSSEFQGGGLPPSPVISTVPVNGKVHTVIIGAPQKDGTVSSAIEAQKVVPPITAIRTPVYWFKEIDTD